MLTVFERENKEKVLLEIYLESIVSVEEMQDEKGVFPLAIREADRETILAFDDNTSCKWGFSTFIDVLVIGSSESPR